MAKIVLATLLAVSCVITANTALARGAHGRRGHCLHYFHKKCTMY